MSPAADAATGAPVPVMVIRTPDERLVWLTWWTSRGYDTVIAALRTFTGRLIIDGYGAYQQLLTRAGAALAGIQQCVAAAGAWSGWARAACSPGGPARR